MRGRVSSGVRRRPGGRPTLFLLLALCACPDASTKAPADTTAPTDSVTVAARRDASAMADTRLVSESPLLSPHDVVASRAYVGRRVRVRGRCLWTPRAHPFGPAIGARDVWQLEWQGVAVYVAGRAPSACGGQSARVEPITVIATVVEDTLPPIGDLPPAPRRYLVFTDEPLP